MAEPRTYLVGASVGVTVADDGTVSYVVYLEDVAEDVANEGGTPEDVAAVTQALTVGTTHEWGM